MPAARRAVQSSIPNLRKSGAVAEGKTATAPVLFVKSRKDKRKSLKNRYKKHTCCNLEIMAETFCLKKVRFLKNQNFRGAFDCNKCFFSFPALHLAIRFTIFCDKASRYNSDNTLTVPLVRNRLKERLCLSWAKLPSD